ncbi:hypothetical protein ACF0H5_011324 [Mactra antiquata]
MKMRYQENDVKMEPLLGRNVAMDNNRALLHMNGNNDQIYDQNSRKRPRNGPQADDEKWRPFWQRGQTTYEEMKTLTRERRPVTQRTKLHHSNIDISSAGRERKKAKISKSASVQSLNRFLRKDGRSRDDRKTGYSSRNNSQLVLPQLEPDIELHDIHGSRNSSAHMSVHSSRHSATSGLRDALPVDESSSEDDEIYESDDDPVVSRKNLDKAGDYIVEHDWILKGKIANDARKVKAMHHRVQIPLPDEDPLETIKSRMDEINMMVKPRAEYGNFLETIDPEQKARIMKFVDISHRDIQREKRINWKPLDRFKDAVSKVLIQYRAAYPRRRYLNDDKVEKSHDGIKKLRQDKHDKDPLRKSSLGYDMQLALATHPIYRTKEDIKRVTQILRATKAFKHLFPAQLEGHLAKVVAYERYDDKRIIAQQGRVAERFYYILTGKVDKVREYRLMSGIVTRVEGCIEKGNTTDPQEMAHVCLREQDLVAKGHVEVLVLDKKDFNKLLHTCEGPPVDFLQGLDLFKEFPCEVFRGNPEAIDFRYYGQETLVVKDSNRTPWLHVVKTGYVKVVRMQTVIDIVHEDKFSSQSKEDLGCVRPFSHASAMLGVLAKQRKQKTIVGAISFPELTRMYRPSLINIQNISTGSATPDSSRSGSKTRQKTSPSPNTDVANSSGAIEITKIRNTTSSRLANIKEDSAENVQNGGQNGVFDRKADTPKLTITSPTLKPSSQTATPINGKVDSSSRADGPSRKTSLSFLPPLSGERRNSDFIPHATYLTREKTEPDGVHRRKSKNELSHRETYLQLDLLKPGDIFGLEHMEPQALASEAPGVTLISDGAEIIKISKRFFLQHAKNNTMLKVETMQREYMTQDEAKTVMYDKETWKQYKSVLLQRTVENLHRITSEKVP